MDPDRTERLAYGLALSRDTARATAMRLQRELSSARGKIAELKFKLDRALAAERAFGVDITDITIL